jgi:hypothetical protein
MRQGPIWLASLGVLGAVLYLANGGSSNACAGQCAPPYVLQVDFHPGTTPAAAQRLLTRCAARNPAVIRVGSLRELGGGLSRAMIYTRVLGPAARTSELLRCLRSTGTASAAWPG